VGNVTWEQGLDLSMTHRWTVDYPEDYELIARIYDELWTGSSVFSLEEILALLKQKPEIQSINARYAGVNWYRTCLDELRTITADQTRDLEKQL
jgi:spore coat polysaccharide biosynthesis protein SpsF